MVFRILPIVFLLGLSKVLFCQTSTDPDLLPYATKDVSLKNGLKPTRNSW